MTGWRGLLRFLAPICLVVSAMAAARTALAAELDWQAVPGCPGRDIVEHRVRIAIGMPLERAGNNRFACLVTRSAHGSYRLELRVEVGSAKESEPPRVIEAATCAQVTDTAVIAIALALGATAVDPTPSASETPVSKTARLENASELSAEHKTKEAAASAPDVTTAAAAATPARPMQLWGAAHVAPIVDIGSLPGLAFGLEPALDFGYRAMLARLSGTLFAEQRKTLPDGSGGEFSLWSVALSLCASSPRERSHARLCAGAEIGRMTGRGYGSVAVARQGSATWVMPRLQVELVTEPWLLGVRAVFGAAAGMPLMRRPFTFGTTDQVHRAGSIVGRLSVGLEIDWE